jgi:membrane-bound serine protease (ClpP class)
MRMRRLAFLTSVFAGFLLWSGSGSAAQPTIVEVVKVEGAIDRPLLGYLLERLDAAEREGAMVVLQLDTAGTLDEDAVALGRRVAEMDVPVIAWVGPAPSRASGAGLLLMYASAVAAVYPGSQTGPLHPLDLARPDADAKDLTGTIEGWLAAHDRSADLPGSDRPLTAQEAIDLGIAQEPALSVPDLLNALDQRIVRTASGEVVLHTRVATTEQEARAGTVEIRFNDLGPVKRVLHAVSSPSMIYVLLVLGLAAVAFELTQPGFGFAGFSGIGMLALAAYGLSVVPVSWLGLGLLLGGVGLMVADVRTRRLGPPTAVGLVAFAAGSFLAWRDVADPIAISSWLIVGAIVASLLYYGFGLTVALQSRDRIVSTQRGLIGLVGETRGTLAPEGPVFVKGAMWRGRASGQTIPAGARVRVRGVDGLVLTVEPEDDPADA